MRKSQPTDQILAHARARIGRVIKGQWTLDEVIGVGGVAAIYAATHQDGSRVAIKMLHPILSAEDDLAQRLVREGDVVNKVGHEAVVRVIDQGVDEADNSVFLVMDLLRGEPLSDKLDREGSLPPVEVLTIMETVLEALSAAHAAGIIHRDIKPENIFITTEQAVRVLDFGIARVDEPSFTKTKTGHTHGTPEFMAPEQALGQRSLINTRTDVYACGATMFVLLTGTTPHEAETPQMLMMRVAMEPARHVQMVRPDLPESVANLVDRALEFNQKDRYPDAASMLADLREALAELRAAGTSQGAAGVPASAPVEAPPRPGSDAPLAPPRKRGGAWMALLVAVLLLAAGAVYVLTMARRR